MACRFLVALGLLIIASGLAGCSRPDATGHYMAKFTNGIYRLQLAQAQNGQLSGQLDTVILNQQGKLEYSSFAASGVSGGGSLSLTFKQPTFLSSELSGSGTASYNKIILTGNINPGKLSTVTFIEGSDADYRAEVNALIQRANNIAAAKIASATAKQKADSEQAFANELVSTTARLRNFESQADVHLARWPKAISSYRAITDKMTLYIGRERSLVGNSEASVARGQISVAMNQLSIGTEQLHNGAVSLQNDFKFNIDPLMKAMDFDLVKCRSIGNVNVSIVNACNSLAQESSTFRQKYNLFSQGLLGLENVYQEESKKQAQLIELSDKLE